MINKEPTILHIETATSICSVNLSKGEEILSLRESQEDKSHASLLTVFIKETLESTGTDPSELDALSLSLGPGSYTGLRIGASVVKGMAYALDIPVIGIHSLRALAQRCKTEVEKRRFNGNNYLICPMIDARRMEVYSAIYDSSLKEIRKTQAEIIDQHSYSAYLDWTKVVFCGNGSDKSQKIITHDHAVFLPEVFASSSGMVKPSLEEWEKSRFLDTAYFEPFYLKEFIATRPKNKVLGQILKDKGKRV